MTSPTVEPPVPQPYQPTPIVHSDGSRYSWSLGITVAILLLQALFFVGVASYNLLQIDWTGDVAVVLAAYGNAIYFEQAIVLFPFALLLLLCVPVCLLRPRLGWHMAMLVQSAILLISLQVYLSDRNNILTRRSLLYLYMLGATLIVVFMNSPEGRLLLGHHHRKRYNTDG